MCGIAGVVDFKGRDENINQGVLKKMSDVIIHRGPDSEGHWIAPTRQCGLSFRRLAIIDLSPAGNQPMCSNDGRHTIVFNGEIYNHQSIREELQNKRYEYRSKTDTETILNGYAEYGVDILQKMVGMWGFAIWDDAKKELFIARDRIGIKPLYYTERDGVFIFASEIKSILQHNAINAEFNVNELPNYLNFGMSSNRESLFKNIKKLPAGHYIKLKENGELELKRYWFPMRRNFEYSSIDAIDAQAEILRLIRQGIKDRMMSDVPFGVFLSGGVDSSLNVALMAELMERPVDTFTVGFKELEKYNELEYARIIAKRYSTNHSEILIDHTDGLEVLDKLAWHEDEPNADPVCIPLYYLSKLTRDSGTTVIQVGEGSDEQFVGYNWMLRDWNFYNSYWNMFSYFPDFLKKSLYHVALPIMKASGQLLAADYLRRGAYNEELYWGGSSIFSPLHQKNLFNKEFAYLADTPAKYASELHQQILKKEPTADYLQRMLYVELTQRLAEILLMRVDKIGMAHSIEARVPFLDHRLVEFSFSLPPIIKTPDKTSTKHCLKKAVEGILPNEIIYRKKQGFWAPVNEWLRTHWHDYSKEMILNSELMKLGIFKQNEIEKYIENHKSGKRNHGLQIFTLLMLSVWYKRFF